MEDLAKKAISGDSAAEKQLFEKLLVRFQYLAKLKIGEEHSQDLAQDACMTVFEKYKTEQFTVSFEAWANGVLRMKAGNYLQKKRRMAGREEDLEGFSDVGVAPADADLKRFLMECLRRLVDTGGQYAQVLKMAYEGHASGEICGALGITSSNYYVILSRGRSLLKGCLHEKGVAV